MLYRMVTLPMIWGDPNHHTPPHFGHFSTFFISP